MKFDVARSILLVCADDATASSMLQRLHDQGLQAVGPVSTAGMALALAAQTTPGTAILVGETTGRRDASELALELCRTWGVDCHLVPEGMSADLMALQAQLQSGEDARD